MTARLGKVGGQVVDLAALPRVTVSTAGGAPILNKEDYLTATLQIAGPDPYSGGTQIRGRGNSTWTQPKKPYRLKLTTAASLLGIPAERDYVLLANWFDMALIRTQVAFEIGRRCSGLAWTPRMRPVEFTLNGVYQGFYLLGEHVEISRPNKVNVTAASGTTGLALTGAYTLEIDQRLEDNAETGFRTPLDNVPIVFDDPDGADATQFAYLQGYVTAFEAALYGTDWLHATLGYAKYVDMPSWVDWYLVNELCANQDSGYYSSCKLYKTRDTADTVGKLVFGPLWDFDLSIANGDFGSGTEDPEGWWTRNGASWHARMFDDPTFAALLRTRWNTLKASLTTGGSINTYIDQQAAIIDLAAHRDRILWDYEPVGNDTPTVIKAWLATRIAWLDANLPA